MNDTANISDAEKLLLELASKGQSGRLTTGAGAAELSAYLLEGHVISARAGDDTRMMLRRLSVEGSLTDSRARQLKAMAQMAVHILGEQPYDPILGLLLEEIDEAVMNRVLEERFEENLSRFLGSRGVPRFTPLEIVWTENIHIGHDTRQTVARCSERWATAASIDVTSEVASGEAPPRDELERSIRTLLDVQGPMLLGDLVPSLPIERTAALSALARMVADGIAVASTQSFEDDDGHGEVWDTGFGRGREDDTLDHLVIDPPSLEPAPAEFVIADDADEQTVEIKTHPKPVAESGGFGPTIVSAEDMDAFGGDLDDVRGGPDGGQFSTEAHNLDRVALVGFSEEERSAFGAPELSEKDAFEKIAVASGVLQTVSMAVDAARGAGSGAAAVQLLVEGCPLQYASLFQGAEINSRGGLLPRGIYRNLSTRPRSEQRRLLNQGLLDLLERALSRAADELPDEAVDLVLEEVAGYRQRLGL